MEEKQRDGKRKIAPSIPANYISIIQLHERWVIENERKQKEEEEEEERRRNQQQQVDEQRRIEEDLKKSEVQGNLDRSNRGRESNKNESTDGGGERDDDVVPVDEGVPKKKRRVRKRYKKKKTQHVALTVEECGSIAPPEDSTPVKDEIRVHWEKEEVAEGNGPRAVTDSTAIETQFEKLSIKTEDAKRRTRWSKRSRIKQRRDLAPPRGVQKPFGDAAATMVWVKKGQNDKPFIG